MPDTLEYPTPSASLPAANFRWLDSGNNPIDFTANWTFSMRIGQPPNAAQITKTTGFTGGNGANGTANLVVAWDNGELSSLKSGRYYFQITATNLLTSAQRILTGSMRFDYNTM